MKFLLTIVLMTAQMPGRDAPSFLRAAAEFELRSAQLQRAVMPATRASATLDWLRALKRVLEAIPIERTPGPHVDWVKTHQDLIVYDEPGGQWLIRHDLLLQLHDEHRASAPADEIAWLMVTNGLPGECEGYVPCYASGLDTLQGEYLRRQPRGAHRSDAYARINEMLTIVLDDLLKRPDTRDFLSVPNDCADLSMGIQPLRAAVAGAGGSNAETLDLIDRLIAYCPR
jgi:hypothetical protein